MSERLSDPNFQERVQLALTAPVPHLYANGFVVTGSNSDVMVALELNGTPVATLNLSFTAAKSLVVSLGGQIAQLEEFMGQEIRTSQEIDHAATIKFEGETQ